MSVEQHAIDKECREYSDIPDNKKPKVAKTMGNWLQASAVLCDGSEAPRAAPLFIWILSTIPTSLMAAVRGGSATRYVVVA